MAFATLFFLLFSLLLPCFSVAQNGGNITIGDSLTADDHSTPWLSPSRDFAFGFHQLESKNLFLLAIWYHQLPDRTIVWYANEDKPAPRGSKLELTADRGLVLKDNQSEQIWRSDFTVDTVAYGVMNDTGNFVLVNRNFQSLWQSFEHPFDTLLPAQIMEIGGVLSSRQRETNFSRGRFQFRLLWDGNAVLNPISMPSNHPYDAYYISGTRDAANQSNSGYQVIFDDAGYLYIIKRNGQRFYLTPEKTVPNPDSYHRATLNFDGVFTISHHPKNSAGNESWTVIKTIPENICVAMKGNMGSGVCGYNSICMLKIDQRPSCKCPRGYSLVNPNDEYGSCKADFILGCEEDGQRPQEDLTNLEELPNTDWPDSDYEVFVPSSIVDCKSSCLQDCLCTVAVFRGDICWKKRLPLSNGREDRDDQGSAFFKIIRKRNSTRQNPLQLSDAKKNPDSLIIVVSVLLGSSVFVNFVLVGVLCLVFFVFYHKKLMRIHQAENTPETNLRSFTYKELEKATDKFKEELGRGSFGIIYKGLIEMRSGFPNAIAVKKLDRVVEDNEKEFETEVKAIGQTHHKNLVRLLGYCNEGQHRLLVYECLMNGTLASFLFGDLKPSWNQRTQIALGIARGLFYLHEECITQIIHCDIKPQNILLDDSYNARISDFGLAKLLMINQTHTNTAIRGTKGYVAPEWFKTTPVTAKVDVYSFGVLLLEIISCRRSVDLETCRGERAILTDWAYDCYREGTLTALVEDDAEALNDIKKLERFVMVAIWCIQEDQTLRPTMKKAMLMLEGIVQVSIPP